MELLGHKTFESAQWIEASDAATTKNRHRQHPPLFPRAVMLPTQTGDNQFRIDALSKAA